VKLREVWREAARNFGSGASHGAVSLVAFLALAVCLGGVATRSMVDVSTEATAFRDAGASVFRLDAPGDIDGTDCDALASVEGIDAAGAARVGDSLRFALLPDLPTPYFDVTPGLARLLGFEDAAGVHAGLVIDADLVGALGLDRTPDDAYLAAGQTPTSIAATYEHPDDGRDATLSGAALGVAADDGDPFDACWVRFWPRSENPLELIGTAMIGSGGTGEATQWNPTLGRVFDPEASFTALPLTALALTAAAVAAALAYVAVRLRRLELASARHVGVARTSLVGIALAEVTIWWLPTFVLALTVLAFAAAGQNPDPPLAALLAGARVVVAASAAWIATTGLATAAIRETHLVRYFQQR